MKQSVLALLASTVTITGTLLFITTQIMSFLEQRLAWRGDLYGVSSYLMNTPSATVSNYWLILIAIGVVIWCIVLYREFRNRTEQ